MRSYIQGRVPEQLQTEMGPGAADIAEIIPGVRKKLPNLEPPPTLDPEQARMIEELPQGVSQYQFSHALRLAALSARKSWSNTLRWPESRRWLLMPGKRQRSISSER